MSLLDSGRHKANAVGVSSKSPSWGRGTPLAASVIMADRWSGCTAPRRGLMPHPVEPSKAQDWLTKGYENRVPLPQRTNSLVYFAFHICPWDQTEAKFQPKMTSLLEFLPLICLASYTALLLREAPSKSLTQKYPLGLWVNGTWPKTHRVNKFKGWWVL